LTAPNYAGEPIRFQSPLIAIISVPEIPVPLAFNKRGQLWEGLIKMGAEGFEPSKAEPSDLQSDPFVHFGTRPTYFARGQKNCGISAVFNRQLRSYNIGFQFASIDRAITTLNRKVE
jgi:hypothetical protein